MNVTEYKAPHPARDGLIATQGRDVAGASNDFLDYLSCRKLPMQTDPMLRQMVRARRRMLS